jgi:heme/copper-type cytochrome/quinol oxidase subunit 3
MSANLEINSQSNAAVAQPSGYADHEHDDLGNRRVGFWIFLISESVIFLSFFVGYVVYKTGAEICHQYGRFDLQ